jgi:predicted cupin superfamily sugar epimerase
MHSDAAKIIERLALEPHLEGGYYREVYRSSARVRTLDGRELERSAGTAVYFVLAEDDFSAFNREQSDEVWHLYAGGPLELHVIDDSGYTRHLLSSDLEQGEPVAVVPAGAWQAARLAPEAEWAFCGCTVAPGFEFEGFELPPRDAMLTVYPQHAGLLRALTRP